MLERAGRKASGLSPEYSGNAWASRQYQINQDKAAGPPAYYIVSIDFFINHAG